MAKYHDSLQWPADGAGDVAELVLREFQPPAQPARLDICGMVHCVLLLHHLFQP